jgi:predicted ATPase
MEYLAAQLARAAGGRGCATFLVGEMGIGKTRLAQEVLTLARTRGFAVMEGRAYLLEGRLAYAPVFAAFGPFLRHLDSTRQARLVSGLSDLGRLFADLRLPAPEPLDDPALEKTRLFEAVARLLQRLAKESPVLLVLDDLQWADPATIELLHYFARGITDEAVLLLGTFRQEEVDTARGLRSLVTTLHRVGLGEKMVLRRLDPSSVAELAMGLLGSEAPGELLSLLDAYAGGTPLFVEALIRACVDAGQLVHGSNGWTLGTEPVPILSPDVRDLVLEHLQCLDATERRVLDLLAVCGGIVPHDILRTVTGCSDEELLTTLQHLHATGFVVDDLRDVEEN